MASCRDGPLKSRSSPPCNHLSGAASFPQKQRQAGLRDILHLHVWKVVRRSAESLEEPSVKIRRGLILSSQGPTPYVHLVLSIWNGTAEKKGWSSGKRF